MLVTTWYAKRGNRISAKGVSIYKGASSDPQQVNAMCVN